MTKPLNVDLGDWNQMVEIFHGESDRGAAILAGSFAEHALGTFLTHKVKDKSVAEKLFGPVGPLSSFSQRIAAAYAFDLISASQYKEFEAARQARNYFAHHPLDASFAAAEVQKYTSTLVIFSDPALAQHTDPATKHRIAYLLACGLLCGRLLDSIEKDLSDND